MKSLTKVLLKLFGLIFLYWCTNTIIGTAIFFSQYKAVPEVEILTLSQILGSIINILITASIGFLLVFKTEKIMRILKIEEENINIEEKNILPIGCKLIGIFVFVSEIGICIKTITLFLITVADEKKLHMSGQMQQLVSKEISIVEVVVELIPVILSYLLIFRTKNIIKFIKKFDR